MKRSFLSRKALQTESLAEVQFVIDNCRLLSQSKLKKVINFNKGYDWLILACFMREQMHAVTSFTRLENIVLFGVLVELVGK